MQEGILSGWVNLAQTSTLRLAKRGRTPQGFDGATRVKGERARRFMDLPKRVTKRYTDQVRLSLAGQRYLSEQQERELLLEALDTGFSLEEARGLLAATVGTRHAAREMTLDRDMTATIAIFAGAKGWISRTTFDHAANLYRRLSGGAVGEAEAKSRVKQMMLDHGWKIRGEIVFGTPYWFRKIPAPSTRSNITL